MPTRGFEASRMIVMLFRRPVSGMAESQGSIANVLWVVDRNRGRSGVAKHMWTHSSAKSVSGVDEDPAPERAVLELSPDFRNPDRVEIRMDRRSVRPAVRLLAPHEHGSMRVEVPVESRRKR